METGLSHTSARRTRLAQALPDLEGACFLFGVEDSVTRRSTKDVLTLLNAMARFPPRKSGPLVN